MTPVPDFTNPNLPPFACSVSPDFAQILHRLGCTIAISTYQAGKVVFISLNEQGQLVQLPRTFPKAMGIAVHDQKMAIATKDDILVLTHSESMAANYPKQPGVYSGVYMPRVRYYTGRVDIHDLDWGSQGLWGVNTSFSCLCLIDDNYSFIPKWQPHFITALEHDDFCHLNGMAMEEGKPRYVTALGATTTRRGWKPEITTGGILMDVPSNEILLSHLGMPHSPRIYDGKLYALLSATGELICIDPQQGRYEVVCRIGSFIRGLAQHGDFLFVARSKLRESSTTFEKLQELPIGKNSTHSGISIIHLKSGRVVAELNYQNSVEEIYDIQVLSHKRRPGILNTETQTYQMGLSIPGQSYWASSWDEDEALGPQGPHGASHGAPPRTYPGPGRAY